MRFNYKAITENGVRIEGTAEASDKFELARTLKTKGQTLLSADPADENGGFSLERINALLSRVKTKEKIIFAKNLSAMVDAGLSLSRGISIAQRQTKNPRLKQVLKGVGEHVQKGGSLHEGLAKYPKAFPPLFIAMVKAGEQSGNLAQSLSVISDQMRKSYELKKKIRGAMIYPAIIIIAMIIVGILMLMFVVPTLTATFKELNVDLPASTQAIITVSDFLNNYTILALGAIVLIITGFTMFFRTTRGKRVFQWSILRIPLIGELVKKTNSARTTRTLSSLLASGVDIVEGLSITRDVVQNLYYKDVIGEAKEKIQKGMPLSQVISNAPHLYPVLVGEMIEVGEETGRLSDMMNEVAEFYENDVENATKNMSTIIEPFLMIVVGVVVGFFAIAMISPTYSLIENI